MVAASGTGSPARGPPPGLPPARPPERGKDLRIEPCGTHTPGGGQGLGDHGVEPGALVGGQGGGRPRAWAAPGRSSSSRGSNCWRTRVRRGPAPALAGPSRRPGDGRAAGAGLGPPGRSRGRSRRPSGPAMAGRPSGPATPAAAAAARLGPWVQGVAVASQAQPSSSVAGHQGAVPGRPGRPLGAGLACGPGRPGPRVRTRPGGEGLGVSATKRRRPPTGPQPVATVSTASRQPRGRPAPAARGAGPGSRPSGDGDRDPVAGRRHPAALRAWPPVGDQGSSAGALVIAAVPLARPGQVPVRLRTWPMVGRASGAAKTWLTASMPPRSNRRRTKAPHGVLVELSAGSRALRTKALGRAWALRRARRVSCMCGWQGRAGPRAWSMTNSPWPSSTVMVDWIRSTMLFCSG